MDIIITMAGLGSRFRKVGYNCPKYMIEAKGKTLFDWSMDSLVDYNKYVDRYVFVVRAEDHAEEFIMDRQRLVCWQFLIVIQMMKSWCTILTRMSSQVK